MATRTLGQIEVDGVTFAKGDNGRQMFYQVEIGRLHWYVLQSKPHLHVPANEQCRPYWAAGVLEVGGTRIRTLNFAESSPDGVVKVDPLYHETDPGDADPPLRLLRAVAEMIREERDPWQGRKVLADTLEEPPHLSMASVTQRQAGQLRLL